MALYLFERILLPGIGLALLIIPGLLLAQILFHSEHPSWKLAVSGVLSLVLAGWIALILGFLPSGITVYSVVTALILLISAEVFYLQKSRHLNIGIVVSFLNKSKERRSTTLFPLLILALFLILLQVGLPIAQSLNNPGFVEFYLMEGFTNDPLWRRVFKPSETINFNVIVKSHEKIDNSYDIQLMTQGKSLQVIRLGILKPGQQIQQQITLPLESEPIQRYDLYLYRGKSTIPYRSLHFWIKVSSSIMINDALYSSNP